MASNWIADRSFSHFCNLHSDARIGFDDKSKQQSDVKTSDTDKVSASALAVARVAVDFTDTEKETQAFDTAPFFKDGVYTSSTGQLPWKPGKNPMNGWISINTPETKAVVGFAGGQTFELDEVTIAPKGKFGAIYVTAKKHGATLANSKILLITALGRARNTGLKILDDRFLILPGTEGILLEPVPATITLKRSGSPKVELLGHDGCPIGKLLPDTNDTFTINGVEDKTPYYRVTY